MAKKTNKKPVASPYGMKTTTKRNGEKVYDLTNSTNILRDMNKALLEETNLKGGSSRGAALWFMEAIEKGQLVVPTEDELIDAVIKDSKSKQASRTFLRMPGKMFAFMYHPKTRANLEYYDITPLVISLGETESGNILGINLHYLEPDLRSVLLDKLLLVSVRKFGEKPPPKGIGQFNIDYDIIKSVKFITSLPCVRTYDVKRILGKPILIPSNEWGNAVALPFENFIKASDRRVFAETRIKIREFVQSL